VKNIMGMNMHKIVGEMGKINPRYDKRMVVCNMELNMELFGIWN
jgi:hypothetical protein